MTSQKIRPSREQVLEVLRNADPNRFMGNYSSVSCAKPLSIGDVVYDIAWQGHSSEIGNVRDAERFVSATSVASVIGILEEEGVVVRRLKGDWASLGFPSPPRTGHYFMLTEYVERRRAELQEAADERAREAAKRRAYEELAESHPREFALLCEKHFREACST